MAYGRPMQVHLLILAGGAGTRLGGRSKADLPVGGRLLDVLLDGCAPLVTGETVVVAPPGVMVLDGVVRVLEDPPFGGPLAGIGAGVEALLAHIEGGPTGEDVVALVSVDSPGMVTLLPTLMRTLAAHPEADGAMGFGGEPEPFAQYLMGVYRLGALHHCLRQAAEGAPTGLRDQGVRKWLRHLDVVPVPCAPSVCRDIDTPEDLAWWQAVMAASRADDRSTQAGGQAP